MRWLAVALWLLPWAFVLAVLVDGPLPSSSVVEARCQGGRPDLEGRIYKTYVGSREWRAWHQFKLAAGGVLGGIASMGVSLVLAWAKPWRLVGVLVVSVAGLLFSWQLLQVPFIALWYSASANPCQVF